MQAFIDRQKAIEAVTARNLNREVMFLAKRCAADELPDLIKKIEAGEYDHKKQN